MLLINHPLDCPICDKAGECTLQNYYMQHDLKSSRQDFGRFKKEKALDIGPTLILDQERCVLCDRCVRFLRDIAKEEQLYIAGRGHEAYITTFPGQEVTSPYSLNTVDLCPVGALTAKDFRFASATWFLHTAPSVCTTCARGCSIEIQSKRSRIHRMRPRYNPQVNGYWMCDEGRLNYKFVNENRYHHPICRRGGERYPSTHEEAVAEARRMLGFSATGRAERSSGARALVLASAACTLEEMFLAKRLASEILDAPVFAVRHVPDGADDRLLRRADKHPNTKGAELLGLAVVDFTGSPDEQVLSSLEKGLGERGILFCVGFNYDIPAGMERLVTRAAGVITLCACRTSLGEKADIVIPGLTFAEKDGLLVNFEGHVQQLQVALDRSPAFAPAAQKVRNAPHPESDWKVLADLLASLGGEANIQSVAQVRKAIERSGPAFANVDLNRVGPLGVRLVGGSGV
jgi:NADH-quinone oxidoreductase subunit G